MELILRWDVGKVKDIIYKCYRYVAESDTLRFPAYVMIKWRHLGDQEDETSKELAPSTASTRPPAISLVLDQYDKMAS